MVDQTQIAEATNGRGSASSPTRRVARSVKGLAHDVMSLVELQVKLAVLDVRQAAQSAVTPVVVIILGAVLALSGLPLLLAGLAYGIVAATAIPVWGAMLIAAAVGALAGGIIALLGWRWLSSQTDVLKRSQQQLEHNLAWIKHALRQDGASPRSPQEPVASQFQEPRP